MPTDVPGPASLTGTALAEATASTPPEGWPVTIPPDPPFLPPPPYAEMEYQGYFWHGSSFLWVALPQDGVWSDLPCDSHGYSQKIPWWRDGYAWNKEPEPALQVTGERLDAIAPPMEASNANGAYAEELSFVVWIAP